MKKKKKVVRKIYYCPTCHNRTPWDKHYALVVCKKCMGEMYEREEEE